AHGERNDQGREQQTLERAGSFRERHGHRISREEADQRGEGGGTERVDQDGPAEGIAEEPGIAGERNVSVADQTCEEQERERNRERKQQVESTRKREQRDGLHAARRKVRSQRDRTGNSAHADSDDTNVATMHQLTTRQ